MAETQLRVAFRGVDQTGGVMASIGAKLKGVAGIIGGMFAGQQMFAFGKSAVEAADQQARAEAQLLTALNGRRDVQQMLIAQADELQKTTLFGDEETVKAQAMLANFVKEGDAIKQLIPLVQDLATVKGMDLSSAADIVARTLGTSTNALKRQGIEVEGVAGSSERLESVMKGLNDAFGGQAKAASEAGAGGFKHIAMAAGELQESLGKIIIDLGNFSGAADSLLGFVTSLNSGFGNTAIKIYGMYEGFKLFVKSALFGVDMVADAAGRLYEGFATMDFKTAFQGFEGVGERIDRYTKEMEKNIEDFANRQWKAEKPKTIVAVKEAAKEAAREITGLRGLMSDFVLAGSYGAVQRQFGGMSPTMPGGNVALQPIAGQDPAQAAMNNKAMLEELKKISKNTVGLKSIEGAI
jgi:hypothetical protein